jgi:hypothetical protein
VKIIGMVIAVLLFGFSVVNQVKGEDMKTASQWKTLTPTQRRAWNAWAKSNKVLLDDGNTRFVSGRKAMTMVLRNRTVAGQAPDPSVVPAAFAWNTGALSLRDAGPWTVNMGFIGFRVEQILAAGTKWFVWATPPLDGNTPNPQAQMRFIKCMNLGALAVNDLVPDIGPSYLAVWGSWDGPGADGEWPTDKFMWLRVQQYANGQLGPSVTFKGWITVEL